MQVELISNSDGHIFQVDESIVSRFLHSGDQSFLLTRRHWRGAFVVRGLPFEDYHLKINNKKFHLDKDPAAAKVHGKVGISALEFEDKEAYFKPGEKKPKSEANPNLKIPAFIEELDSGNVEIITAEPLFLHVRFKGKKLKGLYHFRRTSRQSIFWTLNKGMASFSEEKEEEEEEVVVR